MTILLDFESRSRQSLKLIGGRNYWAHPSTEALCCAWYDTEHDYWGLWAPRAGYDERPPPGGEYAAHNAQGFDRFGAERLGWSKPGQRWVDTSECARAQGWPGKLELLGERYGTPKDLVASRFTTSLSQIRRPAGKDPDAIPPCFWREMTDAEQREFGALKEISGADMDRVIEYNRQDVEIMRVSWPELEEWHDLEPDIQEVDRAVNDRGIGFDSDLARALLRCDAENAETVCADVARKLRLHGHQFTAGQVASIARAPQQLAQYLRRESATAEVVNDILATSKPGSECYEFARARRAVASIVAGKLRAGLNHVSPDGYLRDLLWYYGGHTGRWSSKAMQLHNLPRPEGCYEDWTADDIDFLAEGVIAGLHCATPAEIDLLIRATLCGRDGDTLVVRDFNAIEARALAWESGDEEALDGFRAKKDPYKIMAAQIYGCSYEAVDKTMRGIGKIGVLACGYQMGADKLYTNYGDKLNAAGIEAKDVIAGWRELHAPAVRMWQALEDAFVLAIDGRASEVQCFSFRPSDDGRDVAIFLPSGRPCVYPSVRMSVKVMPWGQEKESPSYDVVKQGRVVREHLYGGMLAENLTQALCRDLMASALVKAERAGLCPRLHVHDEIVCAVPRSMAKEAGEVLQQIMLEDVDWAPGFPMGAAGFEGKRYRK
jgi:DNA polymerase